MASDDIHLNSPRRQDRQKRWGVIPEEVIEYAGMGVKDSLSSLGTSEEGISSQEAKRRLGRYGPNELKQEHGITPLQIFINQFKS
ncbi:hypothetical protein JXA12_01255, partial [Candidatus Woesearchaeota archaeon]|nr:hypothetical protein [Candidatus Woesearchaeota archaeon]